MLNTSIFYQMHGIRNILTITSFLLVEKYEGNPILNKLIIISILTVLIND